MVEPLNDDESDTGDDDMEELEELLGAPRRPNVAILGRQVMEKVQADIEKTTFPTWTKPTPKRIGEVSHGKLSFEELKTTAVISLPITLTRLWGRASEGRQKEHLDNFMHLVVAMRLAGRRTITDNTVDAFQRHISTYLEGFKILHPHETIVPNHHFAACHLGDVLRQWGPWDNTGANPFEKYIGMTQSISTNYKIGKCATCRKSRDH